jgi:PAS domain S-box-containing protein
LKHAVFRSLGSRVKISPRPISTLEVLQGEHDAELVRIKGRLLRVVDFHGERLLTLDAGSAIFEAGLSLRGPNAGLTPPEIGSLLELTGVCSIQSNEQGDPVGFLITLRSAQDVAILRTPSWWTITLMLRMIAILAALVLGSTLWAVLLKRQVAEKTQSIRDSLQREAAARERYQELFENANDMVFTCDLDGNLSSLNKAGRRMTGCEVFETLNKSLAQILPPECAPLARQILQEANQEEQHTCEVEIINKDNTRLRVDLGTRLVQRSGKPPEVQGIGRDITRHRRLEEQLRHAQKMEAAGRLAGGVAHDFNNLLTVISGFGQLFLARLDPTDPKYSHIAEILKAADRGATLTRQLLAFSRQQVLQPEVLDLNNTLANINSMLRHLIGEDIEVVVFPGKDLGRVKADPGEIDQVILNLAVNARDAMPYGGKLTLQTENVDLDEELASSHYPLRAGRYVMLSVSDTGCGMDAETQKHIFEPFFTTKEKGKGTGLGLATVHGIVHQSGGFIYVYSELGSGSIFKIYLPRVDRAAEPAKSHQAVEHHTRGSATILVVEDEAMVRDLTLEVLKESGYTVIAAERPDDALRISRQNQGRIDLLLTDVVMPGMSGLELAERLKPERPEMKVLYVSGYTADAVVRRGMSDPQTAFLQKPFAPGALVRKVREVIEVVSE